MNPDTPQPVRPVESPGAIATAPGQVGQPYHKLQELLARLKTTLEGNDLQGSQQLEKKIVNALNRSRNLSSQHRQDVIQRLETLQPGIRKLASWQYRGTDSARRKLIEEIRRIHDSETDLDKVARRITRAREEWKQWDEAGDDSTHKLYKEFDDACTTAYAPCQKWFDQQRKQREAASKHRMAVCETLEAYYEKIDWREPDWRVIQQTVREQSARWRKLGEAEYQDRKVIQKRYETITNRFSGPLDRERKRNLAQRRELVATVESLAAQQDSRRAIAELQKLKKQWQVTVSSSRKQEQQVWKQFTTACDAVYERGRESRKAHENEQKAQLDLKQSLCEEIEAAHKAPGNSGQDPESLKSQIRTWRQRWKESGRVHGPRAKKVDKRFRDAITAMEARHRQQQSARQTEHEKSLLNGATLCAELEAAILAPDAAPDTGAMESYAKRWSALLETDKPARELLDKLGPRYELASSAATDDNARRKLEAGLDENYNRVNELLLQLEIKTGVDSPEAFAKQRMALQINRLSAAMGKGDVQGYTASELVQRIHSTGAVSVEQQQQIDQRFTNCYQVLQHDRN